MPKDNTQPIAAMAERIELWPAERLQPYAKNARTHSDEQVDQIAASMREFGFTNPILVDSADGIIAGHGRLMAAKRLGLATVPVIVLDHLTDQQRRAYILADNKLALNAGWDEGLLAEEMSNLKAEGFDMDLTGFNEDEINDLLEGFDNDNEEPGGTQDDDAVPEVEKQHVSQAGDVWKLGPHRLMCGDSTSKADVAKLMNGHQAECLWTDPPYNVDMTAKNEMLQKAGKARKDTASFGIKNDAMDDSSFHQFLLDAFARASESLKPGGAAYVAHADSEGLNFRSAFKKSGFKLSGCLIWRKNSLVLGRSDYQWQHEPILYGWKEGAAHRWYGERNKTTIATVAGAPFSQNPDGSWQITVGETTLVVSGKDLQVHQEQHTVINEDKPKRNGEHPTMKPVPLVERFLRNSTRVGDLVLDLFGGSGSTLIACEKTARVNCSMELDPKFADVIVRRWQDYTGKPATLEGDGRTFDDLAAERVPAAA